MGGLKPPQPLPPRGPCDQEESKLLWSRDFYKWQTVDQYGSMWHSASFFLFTSQRKRKNVTQLNKNNKTHSRQDNDDCSVCWKVLEL